MNRPRTSWPGAGVTLAVLSIAASSVAQQPAAPPSVDKEASAVTTDEAPAAAPSAPSGPVVDTVVITAGTTSVDAAPAPAPTPAPAAPTPAPAPSEPQTAPTSPPPRRPPVVPQQAPSDAEMPVASPWWFMGTVDHRWNTSPAFDLYGDQDVTQLYGLAVGYDVFVMREDALLARPETFALNVELGWNAGGTSRDDLETGFRRTELFAHNVHAAMTARYALLPWLAPHVRMSVGLSVVDMELASREDNTTFKDEVIAPLLGLGVGASLQTKPRALASRGGEMASLRLGVRFEVGYVFAGSAGFALKGDDVRVPVAESSLGGLPRSGPSIHTAVFVRL